MKFLPRWDWIETTITLFRQAVLVQICHMSFSKTFIFSIWPTLLNWSFWDKHSIFTWIYPFTTRAGMCCSASLNWYLQLSNLSLITLKVHQLIQEKEASVSWTWMSTLGEQVVIANQLFGYNYLDLFADRAPSNNTHFSTSKCMAVC